MAIENMAFNSYTFIIFFAVVMAVHNMPFNWTAKKVNLIVASLLFYFASHPPFVILLLICIFADWFAARGISESVTTVKRKFFLCVAICVNLGMLGFFKYADFLMENFIWLMGLLSIKYQPLRFDIVLPLGISFFTFQSLTYTFDVYKCKTKPWPSFLDFVLFVTFFPKLAIGPITRAFDFLPQCRVQPKIDNQKIFIGFFLLLLGLFEKLVMADGLMVPVANQLFCEAGVPDTISAWTGTLAFSGQIFFDFAGYSNCAIGVALCLGFHLPENFNYPYAAIGFSDFWRRWHITLTNWLRDYLYTTIGGNRKGSARTHFNLMVTMLLCGLWHGASWTFIAWGGLHGLFLILERYLRGIVPRSAFWTRNPTKAIIVIGTFVSVSMAWVFFRSYSFRQGFSIISSLLGFYAETPCIYIGRHYTLLTFFVTALLLSTHWAMKDRSLIGLLNKIGWRFRALLITILIIGVITCSGSNYDFIYFQF